MFIFEMALGNNVQTYKAIDLKGFNDAIKHWHDQNRSDSAQQYKLTEIDHIADNILLYQRNNGGWPTNKNPLRKLTNTEIKHVKSQRHRQDSSLDNRNTYPQIRYLAEAYQQIPDNRYKQGAIKGLEFLLNAQLHNGGWTHSPPRTDKYYGHITITDDVMTGTLSLMREINNGDAAFSFLPSGLKQKIKASQRAGDKLLLQLQIVQNGKPTAWAGQYNANSLTPIEGRSFELPGIVSRESVVVVKYLMGFKTPSGDTINAVENAIEWFKTVQQKGIRLDKIPIPKVDYRYHAANYDYQITQTSKAPPLWARFYDLKTNTPFFANRDGSKVMSLAEVAHERRTGYSWYGTWPMHLITEAYPAWKARLKAQEKSQAH